MKNLKMKLIATVVAVLAYFLVMYLLNAVSGPMEASIAVKQLEDSNATYLASRAVAQARYKDYTLIVLLGSLGIIWFSSALQQIVTSIKVKNGVKTIFFFLAFITLHGCGPFQAEIVEEIKSNETAFMVPLEGETKKGQAQFMSLEYLEANKVATKRVTVPTRKIETGRMPGSFEWIPTVRVIKVDRTPVTREWTKGKDSGSSPTNQAIAVESLDSIGFSVGVNITTLVTEENAAKFLYLFAGKQLSAVVDENVRGFVQSVLGREFGSRALTDCKKDKAAIFQMLMQEAKEQFATMGITISNIGHAEGLIYDDKEIQEAINKAFLAETDIQTAKQQKLAQDERNLLAIEKAKTERAVAEEFAKAMDAQVQKTKLDIELIKAESTKIAAGRWNGNTPSSVLPAGSNFLFGLDTGNDHSQAVGKPATK